MPLPMLIGTVGFMLGTGGSAIVGITLGEGDEDKANRYFSLFVLAAFLAGVALSVLGLFILRPVAILMGAKGEMLDFAVRYGRVLMVSVPTFILQNMFQSFFVTAEKPTLGFWFTVGAGCTNMVLDVVLVGWLRWGVEGAAIATFISQIVGGVLPVFYFLDHKTTSRLHLGKTEFHGSVLKAACINGSSELMTNLSMSLVNILYNYQLLRFAGENGVAAYGVIMYAAFLFVAVFVGYAVGSAPIVSYHYGARNHAEVHNLYTKSLRLIGVVAVIMTAVSMLIIPYVAKIFVGYDAELLELTSHAFRVYGLSFLIMGFNVYGSSFFTALGDGVTSALISSWRQSSCCPWYSGSRASGWPLQQRSWPLWWSRCTCSSPKIKCSITGTFKRKNKGASCKLRESAFVFCRDCVILVVLPCPNLATERGWTPMDQNLINFIVTVAANVIADYISKWLDRHRKGK